MRTRKSTVDEPLEGPGDYDVRIVRDLPQTCKQRLKPGFAVAAHIRQG